jgi:long-chain acyl-CoA synthetase
VKGEATAPVPIGDDESIASVFAKRAAATPDKVAYGEYDAEAKQWRSRTWAEVAAMAGRVAAALAGEGLVPGDRVAIMLRNSVEWVAFDIGAYMAGLVVVPLYVEDRPGELRLHPQRRRRAGAAGRRRGALEAHRRGA